MISKEQAQEYETARASLFSNIIQFVFPRYFLWLCKIRYRRYKGYMEFKMSEREKRLKTIQSLKKYN